MAQAVSLLSPLTMAFAGLSQLTPLSPSFSPDPDWFLQNFADEGPRPCLTNERLTDFFISLWLSSLISQKEL